MLVDAAIGQFVDAKHRPMTEANLHYHDLLQRAEDWCDRFHEVATNPSGERLRHLRQRHCVERKNYWQNEYAAGWEEGQQEFCQPMQDSENELDRLLPGLRVEAPSVVDSLEAASRCLADLRAAILGLRISGDTSEVCREWFARMQLRFRDLKRGEAPCVPCPGCGTWYWDAADFEAHFSKSKHGFPCGFGFCDSDKIDDEDTLTRHLATAHQDGPGCSPRVYVDTEDHIRSVDEVVTQCRQAYRTALEQILRDRLRAECKRSGNQSALLVSEGLKDIRQWLDSFHEFATDKGGSRRRHLEARRFERPRSEVYGEVSRGWEETRERLDQGARVLSYRLDRVLAVAPAIAPQMLEAVQEAGRCLSDLRGAVFECMTDRDAFRVWEQFYERTRRTAEQPPDRRGDEEAEVARSCVFCDLSIDDAIALLSHFECHHPPPPLGSRLWIDSAIHIRNVENEAQACLRVYATLSELTSAEAQRVAEERSLLEGGEITECDVTPTIATTRDGSVSPGSRTGRGEPQTDRRTSRKKPDRRRSESRAKILAEFKRRLRADELKATPTAEVGSLGIWFRKTHPGCTSLAHSTIYNMIQEYHRQWREGRQASNE